MRLLPARHQRLAALLADSRKFQNEVSEKLAEQVLHAWAEILVPGAGWRGLDSCTGLVTNDTYVTVACGRDALDCPPVRSACKGNEAALKLVLQAIKLAGYAPKWECVSVQMGGRTSGQVRVIARGGQVILQPGMQSVVPPGGRPGEAVPVPEDVFLAVAGGAGTEIQGEAR